MAPAPYIICWRIALPPFNVLCEATEEKNRSPVNERDLPVERMGQQVSQPEPREAPTGNAFRHSSLPVGRPCGCQAVGETATLG